MIRSLGMGLLVVMFVSPAGATAGFFEGKAAAKREWKEFQKENPSAQADYAEMKAVAKKIRHDRKLRQAIREVIASGDCRRPAFAKSCGEKVVEILRPHLSLLSKKGFDWDDHFDACAAAGSPIGFHALIYGKESMECRDSDLEARSFGLGLAIEIVDVKLRLCTGDYFEDGYQYGLEGSAALGVGLSSGVTVGSHGACLTLGMTAGSLGAAAVMTVQKYE